MRNRNTIEYLGIWETLYNSEFKPLEFEGFRKEAGLNAFTLSPLKWVTSTNAIVIIVKTTTMTNKWIINVFLIFFLIVSCEKNNENNLPTCKIIYPKDGDRFLNDSTIQIQIDAFDDDGTIDSIGLIINNQRYTLTRTPFSLDLDLNEIRSGYLSIKAIAYDNKNGHSDNNIQIEIQETGHVVDFDGNTYKTVKIGDQWWMTDNLRAQHYMDGKEVEGSFAYNNETVVSKYGMLYDWNAANNGLFIVGWRVPSNADFKELADYINTDNGGEYISITGYDRDSVGFHLKSKSEWNNNRNGINDYGFSAYPAGLRDYWGNFNERGSTAIFWTSTIVDGEFSYYWDITANLNSLSIFNYRNKGAFSIRLVKN